MRRAKSSLWKQLRLKLGLRRKWKMQMEDGRHVWAVEMSREEALKMIENQSEEDREFEREFDLLWTILLGDCDEESEEGERRYKLWDEWTDGDSKEREERFLNQNR